MIDSKAVRGRLFAFSFSALRKRPTVRVRSCWPVAKTCCSPCRLSGIGKHASFPGSVYLRNRIDTFGRLVQPLDLETLGFHPSASWIPGASGEVRTVVGPDCVADFRRAGSLLVVRRFSSSPPSHGQTGLHGHDRTRRICHHNTLVARRPRCARATR